MAERLIEQLIRLSQCYENEDDEDSSCHDNEPPRIKRKYNSTIISTSSSDDDSVREDDDEEEEDDDDGDESDDSVVIVEIVPPKKKRPTDELPSFECPICWDPFAEIIGTSRFVVVTGSCSHKFCDQCLMDWQDKSPPPPSCPLCRMQLDPRKIVSAQMYSNLPSNSTQNFSSS